MNAVEGRSLAFEGVIIPSHAGAFLRGRFRYPLAGFGIPVVTVGRLPMADGLLPMAAMRAPRARHVTRITRR